jgi:hypothetical protein
MAMARRETAPRVAIMCTLDRFYANPMMYGTKNQHGMSRDNGFGEVVSRRSPAKGLLPADASFTDEFRILA